MRPPYTGAHKDRLSNDLLWRSSRDILVRRSRVIGDYVGYSYRRFIAYLAVLGGEGDVRCPTVCRKGGLYRPLKGC
jgi:hypothetical protein